MSGPPDHGGNKPPGQGMVGFLFEALILIACDAVAGSNRNGANNLAIQPSWRVISLLWSPYNRADHYIFALWFLSFFFFLLSFFPRLISAVGDWMSTILPHMVWP